MMLDPNRLRAEALALVCALSVAACGATNPEALVASAREHLKKNEPASAEIELKSALQKNPQLAEARFLLGLALLTQADYPSAEKEFKHALALQYSPDEVVPRQALAIQKQGDFARLIRELGGIVLKSPQPIADTQSAIGLAYLATGQEAQARQAFEAALKVVPNHVPAQLGLVRIEAAHGKTRDAAQTVDVLLKQAPNSADVWEMHGLLLFSAGKVNDAIEAWRKGVSLALDTGVARARLAGVLIQQNRLKEAGNEIAALKKQAPHLVQTPYLEALLAFRERRLEAAREAVARLEKGAPDYLPGVLLAGLIEHEFKAYASAQAHFQRVLAREPDHIAARRALVSAYLRDNQPVRAAQTLERLLQLQPEDASVASLAGEVFLQTGDTARSLREFNRAARIKPEDRVLATRVALTHFVEGKPDRGFAELETLSAADGADYRPDITLIAARLRNRDFDKALLAIDALEKKLPGNALPANLRGAALMGKGDLAGARKSFEQALAMRPDDFGASMNLAQLDLVTNAPQAAAQRFESLLKRNPKNLQAAMALAELRARLGASPDEVATLLEAAIAGNPTDPAPRIALIALRVRANDPRRALVAAQQAAVAIPDRAEMLDAVARAHEAAQDQNQAITVLQKMAGLAPASAYPLMRIANLQVRNKDVESARATLRRALELAPGSVEVQREMMTVELAAGNDAEAVAIARKVQAQLPNSAVGFVLETDVHIAKRAWLQAIAAARAGLKVTPSTELALRAHSAMLAANQAAEASRFAAEWMKAHADEPAMPLRLGNIAAARRDYAEARKHYQAALKIEPNNPVLLNNVAWVSGKLGDPAAVDLAEKAFQLAPASATVMDTLGSLLVERGKAARGVELLQTAVRLAPQEAAIRLNLARALIAAGKKQDAKRELDTLATLGERFAEHNEVAQLLKKL